jgi:DNA polymerase I-like protein with 3'-5' exonuclease and polymerase domains
LPALGADASPEDVAEADGQVDAFETQVAQAKIDLTVSALNTDADDGTTFTDESAFEARKAIRAAEFAARLGKKGVNLGAKIQQAAILRAAGVPLIQTTEKTNLPRIDKEILEQHRRHEAAKHLLAYILTDKTITAYIEGESRAGKKKEGRAVVVEEDSYLHPLWTPMKITGRWGSSPNVQNWTQRGGGGVENLRRMVEAPEGYLIVYADFAQLEARLIGAMSQCPYMIETFKRGGDIHSAFALVGFPALWPKLAAAFAAHKKTPLCCVCPSCNETVELARGANCSKCVKTVPEKARKCACPDCKSRDKLRDVTKRLEYGGFYGAAAMTLWESVVKDFPDTTMGQIEDFLRQFNARLPEVLVWRQEALKRVLKTGEIRSPILGRLQMFPLYALGRVEPNVVYNFQAQSGGADLWDLGAAEFCKRWDQTGVDARICNNGHDSILVLTREECVPQVELDVRACWEREWNEVNFPMDLKTVKRSIKYAVWVIWRMWRPLFCMSWG